MAEAMLKKMLEEKNMKNVEVYSAGLAAQNGEKATKEAIEVMEEYGVDLNTHRAKNINNINLNEIDLILCVNLQTKYIIEQLHPEIKNKVYTIEEYADSIDDKLVQGIPDPWGFSVDSYKKCREKIEQLLLKIINKLNMGK